MFARKAKLSYGGKSHQAVCESTGSTWPKTYEASGSAGIYWRAKVLAESNLSEQNRF